MHDEKDKNHQPESSNGGELAKNPDSSGLFRHLENIDKLFVFQYKKTEKILAALYLVSNFLPNQEPLRWELRELGLSFLSNIISLKDALPAQKDELCKTIKTEVLEIISLLEIAHFAGFISPMNFEILKKEFVSLLDSVSLTKETLESFMLPNNFFAEENIDQNNSSKSLSTGISKHTYFSPPQKQNNFQEKDKRTNPFATQILKGQNIENKKGHYGSVEIKKYNRQLVVLNLLKKKKEIMVKDVSAIVSDCSEKTIQRELLSMVEQGILKKEGERRWSRYSLA